MRRSLVFVGPVLLAAIAFACEDSSGTSPDLVLPEAGALDSAVPGIDGAPGPDVEVDPPATTVSLTITGRSGPRAGIKVVFHDATGAVIETKATGADGKATSTDNGTTPKMVTALLRTSLDMNLMTWTAVEAGDALLATVREEGEYEQVGKYAVSFPADAGDTYYARSGNCWDNTGTQASPVDLPLQRQCMRPFNENAALVLARRNDGNALTGYAFAKNQVAPTDGGTIAVATGNWVAPSTLSVSVTNAVPSEDSPPAFLVEIAGQQAFPNYESSYINNSRMDYRVAAGFADAVLGGVAVGEANVNGADRVIAKRVSPPGPISVDINQLLPVITGVTVTAQDLRRPQIVWTTATAGSLATTKGGVVRVDFTDGPEDASYAWSFVIPPNATTVAAPALPADADSWLPRPNAENPYRYGAEVTFVDDIAPSPAAFRKAAGVVVGVAGTSQVGFGSIFLPVNNTSVRLTRFRPPLG